MIDWDGIIKRLERMLKLENDFTQLLVEHGFPEDKINESIAFASHLRERIAQYKVCMDSEMQEAKNKIRAKITQIECSK